MKNIIMQKKENYFLNYIYLYVFLMPWNFFNGQMGVLSGILLIWWLVIGKKNLYFSKLKNIIKFKPLLLLIVFFMYAYLSLLWTSNLEASNDSLKFYKYYWVIIPVFFTVLDREKVEKLFYVLISSFGFYSLFSIFIYLGYIEIPFNSVGNPRGILAYAIVTPYMALGFLSSLILAYYSQHKKFKILFLLIAFFCFIGLFINDGRAGQLAFFCTLAILVFLYRKKLFNLKFFFIFLIILSLSIFAWSYFGKLDKFQAGVNDFKNMEEQHFAGSWGQRAYMWYAAAYILKKEPIFGTGVGDNIDEFIVYTKEHPSKATWLRSFHNQHLDILTRYGIVGYLLFMSSIVLLLNSLRENKYFFSLGIVFFSITLINGLADIILLMKPYNNVFMLIFILLSVVAYDKKNRLICNEK